MQDDIPWAVQLNSTPDTVGPRHAGGVVLNLTRRLAEKIQSTIQALQLTGRDACTSQLDDSAWSGPEVLTLRVLGSGHIQVRAATGKGELESSVIVAQELLCAMDANKAALVHCDEDAGTFLVALGRSDLADAMACKTFPRERAV